MFIKPYHIKQMRRNSIFEFTTNRYIAYEDSCSKGHGLGRKTQWYPNFYNKYPFL